MAASRVIKLIRDDDESAYVLIQVIQNGLKPLDVKLIGTEGEAPYVISLKHDRVASLQIPNCPVSESEWQVILQSLFALQPSADIQATASIKSEASLSITVRKRVQGITQRLGSIELKHDENEAIELFQWCAETADALTKSNLALTEAAAHAKELESTVKELKVQLDELITSKQEDETELLLKFRDLLNEKKVKIREQQKVLAAGPIQNSQSSSQRVQPLDSKPSHSHTPVSSRPRKRKVQAVEAPPNELEEDEMELDKIKVEPQDSEQEDTAEDTASGGSDDDNNDDEDDDDNVHDDNSGPGADNSGGPASEAPSPSTKATAQPPAPRALPFAKKAAPAKKPAAEGETESDDEL